MNIPEGAILKQRFRRGTNASRKAVTMSDSEIGFTTDTKRLYFGDGVTVGGNPVAFVVHNTGETIEQYGDNAEVEVGDVCVLGTSNSFSDTMRGLYLRTNSGLEYIGPNFDPAWFAISDGKIIVKPNFFAGGSGFILNNSNKIVLDGSFWNVNQTTGQITFGYGTAAGYNDRNLSTVIIPSKTKDAGLIAFTHGGTAGYAVFGGVKSRLILKNTVDGSTDARLVSLNGPNGSFRFAYAGDTADGTDSFYGMGYNVNGVAGVTHYKSVYNNGVRSYLPISNYTIADNGVIKFALGGAFNTQYTEPVQIHQAEYVKELRAGKLRLDDKKTSLDNILPTGHGRLARSASGNYAFETDVVFNVPGVVLPYAGSVIPNGWLECNGQAVSRETYADLFASIGTAYGVGDGSTTFNVPDMLGRVPVGVDSQNTRETGVTSLGTAVGEAKHTTTSTEVPAHTHDVTGRNLTIVTGVTLNNPPAGVTITTTTNAGTVLPPNGSTAPTSVNQTSSVGSGVAHNNMQPSIGLKYIIRC